MATYIQKPLHVEAEQFNQVSDSGTILGLRFYKDDETDYSLSSGDSIHNGQWLVKDSNGYYEVYTDSYFKSHFELKGGNH
jgi:hypothetical protein